MPQYTQQKQELLPAVSDEMDGSTGAMAIHAAEINQQIATAHQFKRDKLSLILNEVRDMATMSPEVAEAMFYSIPRDGKQIEGASVRLAELFAARWGNLRAGARIISVGKDLVTAQGFAIDLQTNFAFSTEVQRSIKGKRGRFSPDMIRVTCLAAQSIAFREAVFKVIPRVHVENLWAECRRVAIGKAQSIGQTREKVATSFSKMGISRERIAVAMGVPEFSQISMDHVGTLRGMFTAITDGELSLDEAFPPIAEPAKVVAGVAPRQGVRGSELAGGAPQTPPLAAEKPKRTRKPRQKPPEAPDAAPVASEPPREPEPAESAEDAPADGQGPQEAAQAVPAETDSEPAPGMEAASAPLQMQPPTEMFQSNGGHLFPADNGNSAETDETQPEMPAAGVEAEVSDPVAEARRDEWESFILSQNVIKPMKEGGDIRNRVDLDEHMGPPEREYLNALMDRQVAALRSKRQ